MLPGRQLSRKREDYKHKKLIGLRYWYKLYGLVVAKSPRLNPEHLEAAVAEALERGLVRRKRLQAGLETMEHEGRRFSWKVRCTG